MNLIISSDENFDYEENQRMVEESSMKFMNKIMESFREDLKPIGDIDWNKYKKI